MVMHSGKWKIYWNEYLFGGYLYGSKITFHSREDVEVENELMPPGTVIKEWYSKVNYHIQVNMSDFESYLIRMVFYDRYENEAGTLIVREPEMDFKCPLKTYSYRVQLINAGGTKMHFHSFVITEKEG